MDRAISRVQAFTRTRDRARRSWLARSFLSPGIFSPGGDFYRVNEVPAPFYNRRERSPDDDSNNCRAYGRSIGHSACRRGRPRDIPWGSALTAARGPDPGCCFRTSMETRG